MTPTPSQTPIPPSKLDDGQLGLLRRIVHGIPKSAASPESEASDDAPAPEEPALGISAIGEQLFVGTHYNSVDAKGRLNIPVAFTKTFSEEQDFFLTISPNLSLWLFPGREFRRILSELKSAVAGDDSTFVLKKFFTNYSYSLCLDSQGRITVPPEIRSLIFGKDKHPKPVAVKGSGNFIEIVPIAQLEK